MRKILVASVLTILVRIVSGQVYADQLITSGPCDSLIPVICPGGVSNPSFAVDANRDNYAVMQVKAGVSLIESTAYLETGFSSPGISGEVVGIVLESFNEEISADVVENITVRIYDVNGIEVAADSGLSLQNVWALSGTSGRNVLRVPTPVGNYQIGSVRIELKGGTTILKELGIYGIFHEVSCPPVAATQVPFSVNVVDSIHAVDGIDSTYALMTLPVSLLNLSKAEIEVKFPFSPLGGDFIGFSIMQHNTLLADDVLQNLVLIVTDENGNEVVRDTSFSANDLMLLDTLKTAFGDILNVPGGGNPVYIIGTHTPSGDYRIASARLELGSTLGVLTDLRIYNGFFYSQLRGLPVTASNLVIGPGQSSTLTALGGYSNYAWSNGMTGNPVTVTEPGTYTVSAERVEDGCILQGSVTIRPSICSGDLIFADQLVAYGNCEPIVPLACPSGVENPEYAVDNDSSTYALMVSQLGVSIIESTSFLTLAFSEPGQGGTDIGIVIRSINQDLNADVLDDLTLIAYDKDSNEVGRYADMGLQNVGLLSGSSSLNSVRIKTIPGNYEIHSLRLEMEGGANVLQDLAVYGFFHDCGCPPVAATSVFESANTINPQYAADTDPANYAVMSLPLAITNEAYLDLSFSQPGLAGDYVGFTVGNVNTAAQAGVVENLTITVYDEQGNARFTESDFTLPEVIAADRFSGLVAGLVGVGNGEGQTPFVVGVQTNADSSYRIARIRLTMAPTIGVARDLKVYEGFYVSSGYPLSISSTQQEICSGGTATLTASPDFSDYRWSTGDTTQSIVVHEPGLYTVSAGRPGDGCTATAAFQVDSANGIDSLNFVTTPALCSNGSVSTTVYGGSGSYSYAYSSEGVTYPDSSFTGGLPAGNYQVTVTDLNTSCSLSGNFTITTAALSFEVVQPACDTGGSITATVPAGNYSYYYTGSDTSVPIATGTTANGLSSGTYYFFIEDTAAGCFRQQRFFLNDSGVAEINAVLQHVQCGSGISNGSITLDVKEGSIVRWADGDTSVVRNNLSAGEYIVTVSDSAGCSSTASFVILNQGNLGLQVTVYPAECDGSRDGAIDLTVLNGSRNYTFNWSNGAATEDVSGLKAGIYRIIVTDNETGCQDQLYVAVPETGAPLFTLETLREETCPGASDGLIRISGTAANDQVSWSNGGTGAEISGLTPGTYTVTVTSAEGCTAFARYEIPRRTEITVNFTAQAECPGKQDGAVSAVISGGKAPYQLNWSNGREGSGISMVSAGNYTLLVTDNNGCQRTFETVVPADTTCRTKEPFFPEIITPNYDGSNDRWAIGDVGAYLSLSVDFYNRYGELVYSSPNYKNDWEGTFKDTGQNLPDGTYFYLVKILTISKEERVYTGFVVLQH